MLRHKMRSFLTMLGIMIGIASVMTIVSLGEGLRSFFVDFMATAASPDIVYVMPDMPLRPGKIDPAVKRFRNRDLEAVRSSSLVKSAVGGNYKEDALIRHGWRSASLNLVTEPHGFFRMEHLEAVEGRLYTDAEEQAAASVCVLGADVPGEIFGPGEPVLGATITVEGARLRVLGILNSRSALTAGAEHNRAVYVPLRTAQKRIFGSDELLWMAIQVQSIETMEAAKDDVTRLLRASRHIRSGADDDFKLYTAEDWTSFLSSYLNALMYTLASVAVLALLIGGIGVMNIMLVVVRERTHEIGLRKALGATRANITMQFLIEAMTLTLAGGALGIAAGYGLGSLTSMVMSERFDIYWSPDIPPFWIGLTLLVSAVVGLAFGVYPASRAGALDPIQALHHD
ncbi:ABC transporter permease [bacterium]|nr:ABC transporter permease [bacterium]